MRLSGTETRRELDMPAMPRSQQEVTHSKLPELGALLRIRYMDHSLQRNVEPEKAQPIIREAVGRLERQNQEYVYLVVDEYTEPRNRRVSQRKTTGFVILKSTILEMQLL
jgi:hypothetical protein